MPISKGVSKQVAYKKEATWGTVPAASGAKLIRRVTASFNLNKETYESNEIRTDRQVTDFRHGVRSADGSLSGELSAGSYSDFMGSLLAKDFAAVTFGAAVSVTVTVSGSTYKFVRTTGSWITSGFRPGLVVRTTGLTTNGDNGRNYLIVAASALELTFVPLDGVAPTAQGTAASATFTAPGKATQVPTSGHTEDSYSFEQWYSDIAQSEVFSGVKVASMNVSLPATGLTTIDFSFVGKDLAQKGTTQYFTAPTAQNSEGIFAAVNGALIVNGVPVALVTSADFSVERATENATVVGSNSISEIMTGRIRCSGNLSVYFTDASFRNYFDAETPVSLVMALTESNSGDSDFISFTIPKVKFGSFTVDDGELGMSASCSFQALLNDVTTAGLPTTTIAIQDSAA